MKHTRAWHNPLGPIWLGLSFLVCMLQGCAAQPEWERDDPAEIVKQFLVAAEMQLPERMWEYYSSATRTRLEAARQAYVTQHAVADPRPASAMIVPGHVLSSTREYKKIEVESVDASRAVVRIVRHDASTIAVTLLRESNRWTLDLPL